MNCPHCKSNDTHLCHGKTDLGYEQYRCRSCGKQYNERTGTPFNFIQFCTEIVILAVHYFYRFKNSLDDVVELIKMRGINLSHQTVHNWAQTFGVEFGLKLDEKRYGQPIKNGMWMLLIFALKDVGAIYIGQLIKKVI